MTCLRKHLYLVSQSLDCNRKASGCETVKNLSLICYISRRDKNQNMYEQIHLTWNFFSTYNLKIGINL